MATAKSAQRIGVLCVDDNPLVAEALQARFSTEQDLRWLGHHGSTEGLEARVQSCHPDVLLLDLDMPGREAVEALKDVVLTAPDVRVVVLSGHVSLAFINKAIAAGAWGYVSKSDGEAAVLDAVRRVMADEFVLSPEVLATMNSPRPA